jgi:hypothetical protein
MYRPAHCRWASDCDNIHFASAKQLPNQAHPCHRNLFGRVGAGLQHALLADMRHGSAVAGSVDSGKSTLVACLTHGAAGLPLLDNGHGSARMAVFRHKHEIESGRTSSLSQQLLGYAADGALFYGILLTYSARQLDVHLHGMQLQLACIRHQQAGSNGLPAVLLAPQAAY